MQILPIKTYNYNNVAAPTTAPISTKATATTSKFLKAQAQKSPSFTGKFQLSEKMAGFIGKQVLSNKFAEKIVLKFKDANLVSHLAALTGLVLSGFYAQQTLKNDKLDKKKRNTLAINQILVAILSTVGGYTLDGLTNKAVGKYVNKFKIANASNININTLVKGINNAKKLMIFGTMYRFIAPVIVTPIANYIGNKIAEPKKTA